MLLLRKFRMDMFMVRVAISIDFVIGILGDLVIGVLGY